MCNALVTNVQHTNFKCFGNHEFAYKPEGLAPFLNSITYPIIAANVDFSPEYQLSSFEISKSWVFVINGKKIGIIGYITPYTQFTAYPGNVLFEDEIIAIKVESEELRAAGVKTIIALGHSGFEMDKKIAREVPLVDLVVGGHTNTFLWNGVLDEVPEVPKGPYPTVVQQPNGKRVPVVQAYAYTKYMGRLVVTINDDGQIVDYEGNPQLLNSSVPQESDALSLLEKFRPALQKLDEVIIGYSANTLVGEKSICRHEECTLANLVTDAFVSYYKYEFDLDCIGMLTSRTLYHDIIPSSNGSITMLDLVNALPYSGKIFSVSLKGEDIWKTLEIGVAANPETGGSGFVHTSGLQYIYDKSRPVGSRILEVKVRSDDYLVTFYDNIIFEATYTVLVTEIFYNGLDFQRIIKENGFHAVRESKSELEIIVWYLNYASMINKSTENRIISLT